MRKDLPLSFRSGISLGEGHCRVVAQIDELIRFGSTDTEIYEWSTKAGWAGYTLNFVATRIASAPIGQTQVCIGGLDGTVCIDDDGQISLESIDQKVDAVRAYGDLRDYRTIGKHIYAAGMSRQVFRRDSLGSWSRIDEGAVQRPGELTVAGFNSIDGVTEDDIFAVGFGGEIWRFYRGIWSEANSPTNVVLHRVRVVSSNLCFACGQEGVLLRCVNGEGWEVIDHQCTEENFWGMEWFAGRLFLASDDAMFELVDGVALREINIGFPDFTYGDLHAAGGALWSFGPKHLAWTKDGVRWNDATPRRRAAP